MHTQWCSRDHETPSGLRHRARTMKHTKVSDFLKPAAGRYPRNAMGIWLCWDAASNLGSHAYMMLNMPCSASGHLMPSKALSPGAGYCTVQKSEQGAGVGQAASKGLWLAALASSSPPPPLSSTSPLQGFPAMPCLWAPLCTLARSSMKLWGQLWPLNIMQDCWWLCPGTTISFVSKYLKWDMDLSGK